MRAPSSSRMFREILLAMNSRTSGGASSRSWAAFLRRIAMRVSSSGGWMSVISPHSNRLRSRSSSVTSCLGGRSELMTICLLCVVQGVERVEELLLRLLLVLQELDVVDEEDVDVAVAAAEPLALAVANRVDEVVGELLRAHVPHPRAGVEVLGVVPDGVQQVGLAEPGVTVDEQRVVRLGRRLRDCDRGGVGEPVARPDDERLEQVAGVEPGGLHLPGPLAGAVHRRQHRGRGVVGRLVGERGGIVLRGRLHRHGDLDLAAELAGERLDDQRPQPGLQHVTGELVGGREQGGVSHQTERAGERHPRPLLGSEGVVREPGDRTRPHLREVEHVVGHVQSPSVAASFAVLVVATVGPVPAPKPRLRAPLQGFHTGSGGSSPQCCPHLWGTLQRTTCTAERMVGRTVSAAGEVRREGR